MNRNYFTKQLFYTMVCVLSCLFNLAGCTQHNYKKEADEKARAAEKAKQEAEAEKSKEKAQGKKEDTEKAKVEEENAKPEA